MRGACKEYRIRLIIHEGHIFALDHCPAKCCRQFLLGSGLEMGQRGYLDVQSFERLSIVHQGHSMHVLAPDQVGILPPSSALLIHQQETLNQLARNFENLTAGQAGIPVDYVLTIVTLIGESVNGTNSSPGSSMPTINRGRKQTPLILMLCTFPRGLFHS